MKRQILVAALLAAGVFVILAGGVRRVAPDALAIVDARGQLKTLSPGRHWVTPGLERLVVYPRTLAVSFPAPSDTAGGQYRVFSSEGAPLEFAANLSVALTAEGLPAFHAAAKGDARSAVTASLRSRAREVLSQVTAADASGSSRALVERRLADLVGRDLENIGARRTSLAITRLSLAGGAEAALAKAHAASRHRRVLVLGIDSADWTLIDRLRGEGRLPTLDRMVKEGASGPLRSIEPLLSPLIWTTIATGLGPERHGILDFVVTDPATGRQTPATSRHRRAPALWNIAPAYGKKTGVVGWLATWPPEPVDGYIVTDRFGFLAFAGHADSVTSGDIVYPPGLLDGRERLVVPSTAVNEPLVRRYLDVPAAEIDAARRSGFQKGNLTNNFIHTLATAETWAGLGLDLWQKERPDLSLVYFEFLDAVSHLFMSYAPPRRAEVAASDFQRYRRAVDEAYVRQDEILSTFLRAAGDSTIVIVLSDHGFRSGDARLLGGAGMEDAEAAHWHLPDGVILFHGRDVRPGARIGGARVFDVAPTILALLGCPASREMPGRVLAEAFVPGTFGEADTMRLDAVSLEGFTPPATAPGVSAAEAGAGSGDGSATAQVNLGIVHARDGRPREAETAFKKALELEPHNTQATNNLASLYSREGRHEEAVALLRDLLAREPGYAMGWANLGVSQQRLRQGPEALESYKRALDLEPKDQKTLTNRGFLHLDLGNPVAAEKDFRAALRISERLAGAHYGLGMALVEQNRAGEAVVQLERALEIDPGHDRAREALKELKP